MGGADTGGWPSGTVTFLVTDIEGSTRLYQALGPDYETLLRTSTGRSAGPSSSAGAAPRCRARATGSWWPSPARRLRSPRRSRSNSASPPTTGPAEGSVRVRIGVHTGEADAHVHRRHLRRTGPARGGAGRRRRSRRAGAPLGARRIAWWSTSCPIGRARPLAGPPPAGRSRRPRDAVRAPRPRAPSRASRPFVTELERPGNLPTRAAEHARPRRRGRLHRRALCQTQAARDPGRTGWHRARRASPSRWPAPWQASFDDGAWFVDLATAPPACPVGELASRVGSALGIDVTGGPARWRASLAAQCVRCSCSTTASTCWRAWPTVVEAVLDAAPDVRLLATSRERLGLSGRAGGDARRRSADDGV